MPAISRFYGIVIAMYFNDHPPPHVHATYGEHEGRIAFLDREVLSGDLPGRVVNMVLEWCELHTTELEDNWNRAQAKLPLESVDPLP
jgi:hypothetical protein